MFGIRFSKRKEERHFEKTLLQLAVTPAMLNISMLSEEAKGVLEQYLQAVYVCRPDLLPVERMGEDCYREALRRIQMQKAPSAAPRIQSFTMEDYDRRVMYKVKSITYCVVYSVQEQESERQEAVVVFDYDERLGWLMGSIRTV